MIGGGNYMRYDFFYNSEPIRVFNFNTFYYVNRNFLDLDMIIQDAIEIEMEAIESKYGVSIRMDWWDYRENLP